MGLCCYGVTGVERAICDNAGPEAGDSSAGTDSYAAGNLAGAGIGHGGSAEDGEVLGRSEGLRVSLRRKSGQGSKGEEDPGDKPKTK